MFEATTVPTVSSPALDNGIDQLQALDLIAEARSVLSENSQGLPIHSQRMPTSEQVLSEPPVVLSQGPVAAGDTALFRMAVVNADTVAGVCGVAVSPFLSNTGVTLPASVEPGPNSLLPGASLDFTVCVPVPPSTPFGRYHGVATVSGAETGPIVLVLIVGRTP